MDQAEAARESAREHELDRQAKEAALTLFRSCRALGWGSGDPITDATARIWAAARQEGYEPPMSAPGPKRKPMPHRIARKVFDRDDWTCQRRGTHRNLTVDHIIPVSKGGTDELDNLQTLCGPCNSGKGDRD